MTSTPGCAETSCLAQECASVQSTSDGEQLDGYPEEDVDSTVEDSALELTDATSALEALPARHHPLVELHENHTESCDAEDIGLYKRQRKLQKKLREITKLEAKASDPCLSTAEVQEKLARRSNIESEVGQLEEHSVERLRSALECKDTLAAMGKEYFAELNPRGSTISFSLLASQIRRLVSLLGLLPREPPSDDQAYGMMMICSGSDRLALNADEFQEFLREFINYLLAEHIGSRIPQQVMLPEAVPSAGAIRVTIVTMSGETLQIEVDDSASIEALRDKVKASFGIRHAEQRLLCRGFILKDVIALHEQGITNDSIVMLVRVFGPPQRIIVSGHRWRGDVAGIYNLVSRDSDGYPIYKNGVYWLVYERARKRWAINDQMGWNDFADRAYAYCESEAADPCEPCNYWHLWAGGKEFRPWSEFSLRTDES